MKLFYSNTSLPHFTYPHTHNQDSHTRIYFSPDLVEIPLWSAEKY